MHLGHGNGRKTFIISVLAPIKNVAGRTHGIAEYHFLECHLKTENLHGYWQMWLKPWRFCNVSFLATSGDVAHCFSWYINAQCGSETGTSSFLTGGRFLMFRLAWLSCVKTHFHPYLEQAASTYKLFSRGFHLKSCMHVLRDALNGLEKRKNELHELTFSIFHVLEIIFLKSSKKTRFLKNRQSEKSWSKMFPAESLGNGHIFA